MPRVRCHFLSVIMNTFKSIWYIIALFAFRALDVLKDIQMNSIPSKDVFVGLAIFFAIIMIFFIFNLLKWWKTIIYIEDEKFVLERKQISQKKTTVKLSTISTVNLQQNLFERIFDVYTLQLDINSSATADKTDFNLVFNQKTAFAYRDYILSYLDKKNLEKSTFDRNSLDENSQVNKISTSHNPQKNSTEPIISFSFKEVIRHCILSFSFFGLLYAIGVIIASIGAFNISDTGIENLFSGIFTLFLAIIPIVYKSIAAFFLYQNFNLEKNGDRIMVSYGLFTRRNFTLPLDKTNALVIKQPFQARFFNLYYAEIINVGMGDESEKQAPIFCLLVKPEVLQTVIKQIAPQFVLEEKDEKSPKVAIFPTLIKWGFWGILFLIGFSIFYKWWIGLIILIVLLISGSLSHITKGLKLYTNKLSITTGVFNKRTITTTYSKIQNASTEFGPISKHFGLAHGSISILSSLTNQTNSIGYFPIERFNLISEKIVSHDSIN